MRPSDLVVNASVSYLNFYFLGGFFGFSKIMQSPGEKLFGPHRIRSKELILAILALDNGHCWKKSKLFKISIMGGAFPYTTFKIFINVTNFLKM